MQIAKLSALLITFVLFRPNDSTKNIYLQGYGTYPVNWDDNVLIFFVTLKNIDNDMTMASVEMTECCEKLFNLDDTACNHMHLDGSRMKFKKNTIANCTLIYPNAYPHNRKGACNVNISLYNNRSMIVEFQQNIPFDTTKNEEDLFFLQESKLNVETNFRLCKSPDEDPLDLCAPVNCHMKYQGFRSLFNPVKQQCEPIPVCSSKENNNSSVDMVYDPYDNKCIPMANDNITITNIDSILYGQVNTNISTSKKTKKTYNSNIRCHHGKMNEMNTSCICDNGWVSFTNDNFPVITTVPVHRCTKRMYSKSLYNDLPAVKKIGHTNFFWVLVLSLIWYAIIQFIVACLTINIF